MTIEPAIDRNGQRYFIAFERLSDNKSLLCEGDTRDQAVSAILELIEKQKKGSANT